MGARLTGAGDLPEGTKICELMGGPLDGCNFLVDDTSEVIFASRMPRGGHCYELWPAPGRYVYIRLEENRERFTFEGVYREVAYKK